MTKTTVLNKLSMATAGAAVMVGTVGTAQAFTISGTSNPYLAGMPNGFTDGADTVPAQSPVQVGQSFTPGSTFTFNASGAVSYQPDGIVSGPDGGSVITSHFNGAENGISNISAPVSSLLGVFLGPNQPNLSPAPNALDFSSVASRDYLSLAPQLNQVFFIGDGVTSNGTAQQVVAPTGAQRLFLGTMDAYEWSNNPGAFNVNVTESVPEPRTTGATVVAGGIFWLLKRKQAASHKAKRAFTADCTNLSRESSD